MSAEFSDFIRRLGFEPPTHFEPGRFVRFSTNGKRRDDAGYAKLFPDGEGGIVGDFRSGLFEVWQAKREKPLTEAERKARREQVEQAKREAEAEREREHANAREVARQIWEEAQPATDDHPYLQRKGVPAYGLRVHEGKLIIPMHDGAELHSLQTIGADGKKLFLTGGRMTGLYFSIGKPKDTLCVAEGYATGAAVHQATGYAVAVSFSAGNLEAVASALRAKFPQARIVIAGDNDESDTGQRCAKEAARAVGGLVVIPADAGRDWNDIHQEYGADAVRTAIEKAQPSVWPEPLPLIAALKPEPYPIDALPDKIRRAVEEVQGFTKAPVPLVAASALTSLSVAAQALYDIERAVGLAGPVSLFLLTIADSGERKTTCDGYFTRPHREYQKQRAEAAKSDLQSYRADLDAWEAKRAAILSAIRGRKK